MGSDKRSAWLQKLDAECPHQITLPRRQLTDDAAIMDFLLSSHLGKFDMYVEDDCRVRPILLRRSHGRGDFSIAL